VRIQQSSYTNILIYIDNGGILKSEKPPFFPLLKIPSTELAISTKNPPEDDKEG
jgi:hypothetical protein